MSPPPFHVAVFGPAAEYADLVPEDADVACIFVQAEGEVGAEDLSPSPRFALVDLDFVGDAAVSLVGDLVALGASPTVLALTRDPESTDVDLAREAGAAESLVLPDERQTAARRLREALDAWRSEEDEEPSPETSTLGGFPGIVGRCRAMRRSLTIVRKVIESGANTVLIRGETGTGKELVARAIHYQSAEGDRPFIEVNCTAIPETLLEAELFGHEAGAFTDAKTDKKGLLQLADGGTLFLDELGDMSPNLQGKLLRAIETKRFRQVGGMKEIAVSMRIVTATSRDLEEAIAQGVFRSDLYYRLNVVSVELPPLRDREDDVILLAEHFAERYAEQYDKPRPVISDDARAFLRSYRWPGNIRELKNAIERAVLLGEGGEIEPADLGPAVRRRRSEPDTLDRLVIDLPDEGLPYDEYERIIVARALERNEWNRSQTARELQISRPRLLRKIEKYELEPAGENLSG